MIKLSLPGFYANFKYIQMFLNYYNEHLEYFYEDRIIDSFYDADPSLLWRGGRTPRIDEFVPMNIILDEFNKYPSIKLRHVFTNCLLTDQLINDYTCNKFVKDFFRPQDEVVLNHPLLIKHFQNNYPWIPIIYSTTMGITDSIKINAITENNIYVLNYNYNNNDNYLKSLKYKENIEILCAEPCDFNCPNRYKHYKTISKEVLLEFLDENQDLIMCPFGAEQRTFYELMQLPHAITNERIKELEQQGFQYFKISGRTVIIPQWLETIIYYLVKPEYIDIVRQKLINMFW